MDIVFKGIILVIFLWNFLCVIFIGGIVVGLVGGNIVILKLVIVVVFVVWLFVKVFWDVGVFKEVL